MTVEKLKIICEEVFNSIMIEEVVKVDLTIRLSDEDTLIGYRKQLEDIAKEYNIEDVDNMVIKYVEPDYCSGYDENAGICTNVKAPHQRTKKEIETIYDSRYPRVLWKAVYAEFIELGYKRAGYDSRDFKEFDDTSVYKMYKDKEFDRLLKYYSLRFKKIEG